MEVIIFDLDGTLLNTLEDLYIGFNYALDNFGYPKRTREEIRGFVGNGIRKAIERALPHSVEEAELEKIVTVFKKYYSEHMSEHTKPYEGITEILKELKEKGYAIGVASNKYDLAVKGLCKKYFGDLVDIAIGEGNGINKKPAPDGVLKIINELKAEEAIYIGDSEVDIQTAKNSGLPCISVLWGYKDREFLEKNGAKIFAEKPKDIIKIIEKKIYLE